MYSLLVDRLLKAIAKRYKRVGTDTQWDYQLGTKFDQWWIRVGEEKYGPARLTYPTQSADPLWDKINDPNPFA